MTDWEPESDETTKIYLCFDFHWSSDATAWNALNGKIEQGDSEYFWQNYSQKYINKGMSVVLN